MTGLAGGAGECRGGTKLSDTTEGLWRRLWRRLGLIDCAAWATAGFHDLSTRLSPSEIAFAHSSYPRNHTYRVFDDRLVPRRRLAVRVAALAPHYPAPLTSLVDLSCSKGYFAFHAAANFDCRRVLGVDVSEPCLAHCRLLRESFEHKDRVRFERLTLSELARSIAGFGGPFQAALLLNTYQYLVFGSLEAPAAGRSHREIFELIRRVCSGRVIFQNRLTVQDLQHEQRGRCGQTGFEHAYDPETIVRAAEGFFRITILGRLNRRPLLLLDAR